MPKSQVALPMLLALLALTLGALPCAAETPLPSVDDLVIDRIDWSGDMAPGAALIVTNPYGDVRVRKAKDRVLRLHGVAQRLDTAGERLAVDVVQRGDETWVNVTYPPGAEPDPQRIATRDRLDRMDLALHVPSDVSVTAQTTDGLIDLKELPNVVAASSRDGDIKIATDSSARAESVSGRIEVLLLEADWPRPVTVETKSGDIAVEVPPEASLNLQARTGGVLEPLPWAAGVWSASAPPAAAGAGTGASSDTLRGTVHGGGAELWIQSEAGRIQLRTAPRLHRVERAPAATTESETDASPAN